MQELEALFQDYAPASEDFYDDLEELLILSYVGAATAAAESATAAAADAFEAAEEANAYSESVAPDYADVIYPIAAYTQCCWHEGGLYVNNTTLNSADSSWTAAHWDETDISTEIARCMHLADVATVAEAKTYLGI